MTSPFVILQDTREPHPDAGDREEALFRPYVYRLATKGRPGEYERAPTRRATLATGDYSIHGLEDVVAIERKTLPDLIGTLLGSRLDSCGEARANADRFRSELERMRAMPPGSFRVVVVEASVDDVVREMYKVPKDALVELARADAWRSSYAGSFAAGAIRCEACPGYRWPGQRCALCAAAPPGDLYCEGVNALSLLHYTYSLEADYCIGWHWAGDRSGAERYVGAQLHRIWQQASGVGAAFRKGVERGVAGHRPWLASHTGEEVPAPASAGRPRVEVAGGMPTTTGEAQRARTVARRCR